MPLLPGGSPVSSAVRAAAVVEGNTVCATSRRPVAAARKRACPARAVRFAAPRPSRRKITTLRAGANHVDSPAMAAIDSGSTPVRLRARGDGPGRLVDIPASLPHG